MRDEASRLQREYYRDDDGEVCSSFKSCQTAGQVEIRQGIISASPDLVSAEVGTTYYTSGSAHPNAQGGRHYIWSRRLGRLLEQKDVLSMPPDHRLRLIAQARFDHRDLLQDPNNPDGIPLFWDHASIGPEGITWSFGSYELGGYPSHGETTVSWADLKPYLRRELPFNRRAIRLQPDRSGE